MIREITENDLDGLLRLYMQLHDNPFPETDDPVRGIWAEILADRHHHIIVAEEDGRIVSSCVCIIVPNLTRGQRPYALIENVVTDAAYRRRRLASACLAYAKSLAERENCYKIMLMTGAKDEATLHFYEQAGYDRHEKTAFIQHI